VLVLVRTGWGLVWVGKSALAVDQEPRVDPIVDIVAWMYPDRDIES
jgi:hypothetical protein